MKIFEIEKKNIRILGRTNDTQDSLVLFWHGSGIELNIEAKDLYVEFEAEYSYMEMWIGIWIDGALINRFVVPKGKSSIPVFKNFDSSVCHHVQIIKETQPMSGDSEGLLKITGIETDGILKEVPKEKLRIEFIGDSITSGEGTVGAKNEMSWCPLVMSASFAYPFMTAQRLSATCEILSQGGWGVYSGWDGDKNANIPSVYEQVCSVLTYDKAKANGSMLPNDFNRFKPDIIFVNLGTNDNSSLKEIYTDENIAPILKAVKSFLVMLRKNNPNSEIIWGYGAFPGPLHEKICETVIEFSKEQGDNHIRALKLPVLTDELMGSRCHPGRQWHELVTELLCQEFLNVSKLHS